MYHIRPCTLQDEAKVEEVFLTTWLAKNPEDAHEAFIDEMKKWDQYFLAEDGDHALGFVTGKTKGRPRHGLYELYHIWVIPESRWTELAKDLFDTLVNHAKKVFADQGSYLRKFYLKTGEGNEWAHKFYRKMGMTQTDMLHSHFAQWRSELIFDLFFDKEGNKNYW